MSLIGMIQSWGGQGPLDQANAIDPFRHGRDADEGDLEHELNGLEVRRCTQVAKILRYLQHLLRISVTVDLAKFLLGALSHTLIGYSNNSAVLISNSRITYE